MSWQSTRVTVIPTAMKLLTGKGKCIVGHGWKNNLFSKGKNQQPGGFYLTKCGFMGFLKLVVNPRKMRTFRLKKT